MGANFDSVVFSGKLTKTQVGVEFVALQKEMCYEMGHGSYAGHLGIKHGLKVHDRVFDDIDKAREWIAENNDKWEHADAVKYRLKDGSVGWLAGGWCSS